MAVGKINDKGFTLIELMIVVAIISILASIGIPEYYSFICKANQSEVKESLGWLARCEEAYFVEHDTYSKSKDRIGFYVKGKPKYDYQILSADHETFDAEATANFKGKADSWTIDQTLEIKNKSNACTD